MGERKEQEALSPVLNLVEAILYNTKSHISVQNTAILTHHLHSANSSRQFLSIIIFPMHFPLTENSSRLDLIFWSQPLGDLVHRRVRQGHICSCLCLLSLAAIPLTHALGAQAVWEQKTRKGTTQNALFLQSLFFLERKVELPTKDSFSC